MHEPRDLIDAMRRVNVAARIAELDGEDFAVEIAQLDALAARLDARGVDDIRMQASLRHDDLAQRMAETLTAGPKGRINRALEIGIAGFFPYSPYVGTLNPLAPPIDFATVEVGDRAEVHATHTFEAIVNGPPGGVHGGVVAGVFDELLGCTCVVNDVSGFTGTLSIRYSSLTPLGVPITMRGWVERVDGRKTFARGTFHHGDTLCATADGIFIGPKSDDGVFGEAPGDP
ncbi:MAG: hypothetical protein AAF081_01150 [Actinomycetota bacterium]